MVLNYAEQAIGGAAAAAVILSDHLTGTAWYQRTPADDNGSTADFADALRDAAAADMFAMSAERASFDGMAETHQEVSVPLLTDEELDAMSADIDMLPAEEDELSPIADESLEFVVPFADGLGLDWPADDDDDAPFMWAGSEMSEEVPF